MSAKKWTFVAIFCPFFILLLLKVSFSVTFSGQGHLGPPPHFQGSNFNWQIARSVEKDQFFFQALSVNPQHKEDTRDFYNNYYLASPGNPMNWTGDHGFCDAGTNAQQFVDAVLLRINYFRAMAGVPAGVTFSETYNQKAQQAALMMSVNHSLSHSPPTSWTCYTTEGAEAAGSSNLYLGRYSWEAITGYIKDSGSNNYFVGHRRWILYPQTQVMGTGDIPQTGGYNSANALWVFDTNIWGPRPATREEFVSWPPPGYVPYQVVFPRWSFSYPGADFSGASVSMTKDGNSISVISEPLIDGFYGENTLVWRPYGMSHSSSWPLENSATYDVSVENVVIGGSPRDFAYEVHVFDPGNYQNSYIYVEPLGICGGNSPCYSSIQNAIDGSDIDSVIRVAEGEYPEFIIVDNDVLLEIGWNADFTSMNPEDPVVLSYP